MRNGESCGVLKDKSRLLPMANVLGVFKVSFYEGMLLLFFILQEYN